MTDLDVNPLTVPTLLSIESEVAPVTLQDNAAAVPAFTVAGVAVNDEITGGAGVTVTVTFAVVLPPALVAVSV